MRSTVAVVATMAVMYVMFRAWSVQSSRTVQAAPNATNTSAFDGATAVLDAGATTGAQLPVVGLVALVAGVLLTALLIT